MAELKIKFSDFYADPDTTLVTPASGDIVLIYDVSEPLDVNKIKAITYGNLVNLAAQSALQALVSGQAAGDMFYASSATALARKAKGKAGQVWTMNAGATAPEWGARIGACCIAKNSGSQTFTSSGGGGTTIVSLGAEDEDIPGWHSNVTNDSRITVDENGLYLCIGRVVWAGNATEMRRLTITVNGTSVAMDDSVPVPASFSSTNKCVKAVRLTAGQYVELRAAQTTTGSLDMTSAYLEVIRIG